MNREIKFRGKRIDNDEWVYGYYFKTPLTDENSGVASNTGWFFLPGEVRHCISNENGSVFIIDSETLGQFTGLKDKNNKEGYEKDIVIKPSGIKMVISWDDVLCKFLLVLPNGKTDHIQPFSELEIIGNICDKSDLLNQ